MADANQLAQLKMDTKTTLQASDIHIHDFSFESKVAKPSGGDLLERVTRAAKQATETKQQPTLKMGEFDVDFDSLLTDLGDESPEDALLREARKLIKQEQFQSALTKLDEVLEIAAFHHEAIYLKAFCQFKLKEIMTSLKLLRELKDATLKNRLRTRVRALKEEIRQTTVPKATRDYANAVKTQNAAKIIDPLRAWTKADPEVGKFHYFLAGAYLIDKRIMEAREAAYEGLKDCETDRDELEELFQEIETQLLPRMLAPARDFFRKRQYGEATTALTELPASLKACSLWKTFDGYLKQYNRSQGTGLASTRMAGGLKAASDPPGSATEVKELYEFLVEPEMRKARAALEAKKTSDAERALNMAISCTPNFSVANHMLATCVYQRVGAKVKNKIGKDLDKDAARDLRKLKEELDNVRNSANIGSRDSEISDGKRLLNSIDEMRKEIEQVVDNYETQTHDAKLVNKLIDDFVQVLVQMMMLKAAKNVSDTRNRAESLYAKLKNMRTEIASLRRQCKGDKAIKVMDLVLNNFVEPAYNSISRAMGR